MPKKSVTEWRFPTGGLNRRLAKQTQPPYTTPDCRNVRPKDVFEGRDRGGSRPGTIKAFASHLGLGTPVRLLFSATTVQGENAAAPVTEMGSSGAGEGQNLTPKGITVSGTTCYVCDEELCRINVYTTTSGAWQRTFGTAGAGDGQLSDPSDICVDPVAGEVYVVDTGNHRVVVFSASTGAYVTSFGSNGTGDGQFSTPRGIVFYDSKLYVTDGGNFRVQEFTKTGGVWACSAKWGSAGTGNGAFGTYGPAGITNYGGKFYVCDPSNKRVNVYTSAGVYSATITKQTAIGQEPFTWPVYVRAYNSEIFVADSNNINVFQSSNNVYLRKSSHTSMGIGGMWIDSSTGYMFITVKNPTYMTLVPGFSTPQSVSVKAFYATTSQGSPQEFLVASAGGYLYSGTAALDVVTTAVLLSSDKRLNAASWGNDNIYIADYGDNTVLPKRYSVTENALYNWTDVTSERPVGCPLICRYMDRIVLAGAPPHTWYMSRRGDPGDWYYGADAGDTGRPIYGQDSEAGAIGEPIMCLAPWADDSLLFGCLTSLWMMRGDPAYGGRIDPVSYTVGVVDSGSCCHGPAGELYFLSASGLHMLPPGGQSVPQAISPGKLPDELRNVSALTNWVTMAYDPADDGIHLFISPKTSGTASHWWYDMAEQSFWPVSFANANHDPFCAVSFGGEVLMGGKDGYIRKHSKTAVTDDGTAIASYVMYGPFGNGYTEARVMELAATLDTNSANVTWSTHPGQNHQAAVAAPAQNTGTWSAGFNGKDRPRTRGASYVLKVSGTALWAVENITAVTETAGKLRK